MSVPIKPICVSKNKLCDGKSIHSIPNKSGFTLFVNTVEPPGSRQVFISFQNFNPCLIRESIEMKAVSFGVF